MSRALPESVPGVCEVTVHRGRPDGDVGRPGDLLIEVPHGATEPVHYDAVRSRLSGRLPDGLERFFFVNTDVGAPECATEIARVLTADGNGPRRVVTLRGLVPRTFIDLNRAGGLDNDGFEQAGFTPQLPDYVTDPRDAAWLARLHADYQRAAVSAYDAVCGAGGSAIILHTYAPRSVGITRIDAGIVAALEQAYRPETYERWPRRPEVEVIGRAEDGTDLAPSPLVEAARERYAAIGVRLARDETYLLHPATMGHRHASHWRGRVLCVELNRGALAEPFEPFRPMRIGAGRVARLSGPLAAAWLAWSRAATSSVEG